MSTTGDPERQGPEVTEEATLQRLLHLAGRRPQADPARTSAAKESVRGRWRAMVAAERSRRRQRRLWTLAAAVALVALGTALLVRRTSGPGAAALGNAEMVVGEAWARSPGAGEREPLRLGAPVVVGSLAETAPSGYLSIGLSTGGTVRLDRDSRVRWLAPRRLALDRGAVYVDTAGGAAVEVGTALGTAHDLGTRFEVRLAGGDLTVRVRQGRVALDVATARAHFHGTSRAGAPLDVVTASGRWIASTGEELTWGGGTLRRTAAPSYGPSWEWTLEAAPPFALEGSDLDGFLSWLASETGWQVRFADPSLRRSLQGARLHGDLGGVRPDRTPAVVLPALGLASRLEGGTLEIEAR